MRIASTWPDDATASAPANCPDGTWPAIILEASEVLDPYTAQRYPEDNPTGQKLKLRLQITANGRTYTPTIDVPTNWHSTIAAICSSAGVTPPSRDADWDERRLEGQQVIVTTGTRVDGKAREWTKVDRWHHRETAMDRHARKDGPPEPPAKLPSRARAKPAATDDIPF